MGNLLLACAVITAMLTTLTGLAVAGRWMWLLLRKLARLADDWTGEDPRPGLPNGRPGLLKRLDTMEARLERLEVQMQPNGGKTLRDTVDLVAAAVIPSLEGQVERSAP